MITYRRNPAGPKRTPPPAPTITSIASLAWLNDRIRHQRLYAMRYGREVVIGDQTMPGLSFSLPIDTPAVRMAALAIAGANERRRFIYGSSSERKAA